MQSAPPIQTEVRPRGRSIEFLLDKAVSHKIHIQVMNDIDKEPGLGKKADLQYHEISNQAFYDVAQALGMTNVKLAPVH